MHSTKIRTKLLVLVIGVMFLMGLAVASWLGIRAPIDRLKEERQTLASASLALGNVRIEAERLLVTPPNVENPRVEKALAEFRSSFAAIGGLRAIPALGEDAAGAVEVIGNVGKMIETSFVPLKETYDGMTAASGVDFLPPLNLSGLLSMDRSAAGDLMLQLIVLNQKAGELGDMVDLGMQSIASQYAVVDEGIARIESRSLVFGLGVTLLIVLGTFVLALVQASGISRTIEGLDRQVSTLSTGDLSVRFTSKSRDELGRLAQSLNAFLEVLGGFHGRIKEVAAANSRLREQLRSSVQTAMSSSEEIEANSRSISKRMEAMDELGRKSKEAVDSVASGFAALLSQVEAESRLVADSSASVTQMLASIENIARITDQDRASAEALVEEADRGREVFEESFDRLAGIAGSVDAIQEMANVIKGVAEQTNLLAMNAAIEAAHAGEAGKGFAVVADEIRKLSETAGSSSREISRTIGEVTERIRGAVDTRTATEGAFDAISRRIVEVSRSISEIYANVAEMQAGGRQVLDAMGDLRDRSTELAERSRVFDSATGGLAEGMESLLRISAEVVANITEIVGGIGYIGESVRGIAAEVESADAIGAKLDGEIGLFRA